MMGYRDKTYCTASCGATCELKLTDEVKASAIKWWGAEDAPIASADMSSDCKDYKEQK